MQVYFTNFFYFAQQTFADLDSAIAYGKSKGFDFSVHASNGNIVAAWSSIGGMRF